MGPDFYNTYVYYLFADNEFFPIGGGKGSPEFEEKLEENGIETISDESLLLSSSPVLNEIVAFMRFLEYPPDDLSFLSFITGDIFNSATGRRFSDNRIFINKKRPLYKSFKENYPSEWEKYIKPFFQSAGLDRKSTRLNSSHIPLSRMPSSA